MTKENKSNNQSSDELEIQSLNVEDLDVEELEKRLELTAPDHDCWSFSCTEFG